MFADETTMSKLLRAIARHLTYINLRYKLSGFELQEGRPTSLKTHGVLYGVVAETLMDLLPKLKKKKPMPRRAVQKLDQEIEMNYSNVLDFGYG